MEVRYRQAFSNGSIIVDSAITKDALDEDNYRGYLSLNGYISLDNGYKLDYSLERVSDNAYLGDYGYSGRNGLTSGLSYYKTQYDRFFETSIGLVQSLYKDDISKITIDTSSYYERVLVPKKIAGRIYLSTEIVGSWRNETHNIAGRDAARFGSKIRWQNTAISKYGMEYGGNLEYNHDIFLVAQDTRYESSEAVNSVGGNAFVRYPLLAKQSSGTHLLEPLAQIAWGWREQAKVSNDESSHAEFDMGNLIGISRFAASDRYEDGSHGAYGIRYSYETSENYRFDFGLGKVLRKESHYGFTDSSGLQDRKSENYITGSITLAQNSYLSFKGLVDEKLRSKKSALTGSLDFKTFKLDAAYNYLQDDLMELRRKPVEEWTIGNNLKLNKNWNFASNLRFDETENHLALLGAGLTYENQCVIINLEMDRRYAQEGTSPPTTNFSFAISLKGFSTGRVTALLEKNCK
jgi:LPS-assembly protein